jgi:hypothetical protein
METFILVVMLSMMFFIACLVGWQKCLKVIDLVAIGKNSAPLRTEEPNEYQNGRTADCYMNSFGVQTPKGTQTMNSGNGFKVYPQNLAITSMNSEPL